MLMQAEPVYLAYKDIEERIQKRIQNAKMQNAETEEQDAEVKVQNAGIQDAETVSPDKKLRVVYLSPQGFTMLSYTVFSICKTEVSNHALFLRSELLPAHTFSNSRSFCSASGFRYFGTAIWTVTY